MKVPPINCKVFERTTVLKNGMPCRLRVSSEAPQTFQFDMFEIASNKNAVPQQYHVISKNPETARTNCLALSDKLSMACDDYDCLIDLFMFFSAIGL